MTQPGPTPANDTPPGYPAYAAPQAPGAGFPPPPPAKKSNAGKIVTIVILAILLVVVGTGVVLALPIIAQTGATITTPQTVGAMELQTDDTSKQLIDQLKLSMSSVKAKTSTAALYKDADEKPTIFVGFTGTFFIVGGQIDAAFKGMGTVTDLTTLDAGTLGGDVKCGSIDIATNPSTVCGWADHGSVGVALFVQGEKAASGKAFLELRTATLHRS